MFSFVVTLFEALRNEIEPTMPTMDASSLISFNNKAIGLMNARAYEQCLRLLECGLRSLHSAVRDAEVIETSERETRDPEDLHVVAVPTKQRVQCNETGGFVCFFDKALFITSLRGEIVGSDENHRRLAQTLLYNMGLACHFTAADNHEASKNYNRALKFYRMAAHMHSEGSQMLASDYIVRMACLNNMSRIYYHFAETVRASECLQALQHVLQLFHYFNLSESLTTEDEFHFSFTICLYEVQGGEFSLPAPAA